MDKRSLNNEIVLCRQAVRKAKVAVIRRIVKNMRILKSCKIEAMKEKKLRRSERLFKKVQMMKKIKDDEVTKFALRHTDIKAFLKGPKLNLKQSAMAHLAKHQAVAERVNFIREQFQNWEEELPILLDTLGQRKKKMVNMQKIVKSSFKTTAHSTTAKKICDTNGQIKKNVSVREPKVRKDRKTVKMADKSLKTNSDGGKPNREIEKLETIKKIEDPFFIGKKIVAPKLVLENTLNKKNSHNLEKLEFPTLERESGKFAFPSKASRGRRNSNEFSRHKPLPMAAEEKLHPSWAAKKVKLIKPFQGKKITFSDD